MMTALISAITMVIGWYVGRRFGYEAGHEDALDKMAKRNIQQARHRI